MSTDAALARRRESGPLRKIAIVDGGCEVLDWLDDALDPGFYEIVLLDNVQEAYGQIRDLQPDLVFLHARIEDLDSFQLLTMLKLDPETRGIPIQTCTPECDGQGAGADPDEWCRNDATGSRQHRSLPLN